MSSYVQKDVGSNPAGGSEVNTNLVVEGLTAPKQFIAGVCLPNKNSCFWGRTGFDVANRRMK